MSDIEHLKWEKLGERDFKGAFKTYRTKKFGLPNGKTGEFDVTTLKHDFYSMALALTEDMDVILATQFRPGPEEVLHELPAGMRDKDEDPEATIDRELLEETGHKAGKLIRVSSSDGHVQGPYDDARGHYFLAMDCIEVQEPNLDEFECIQVTKMPLREFVNDVLRQGRVTHADCAWIGIDYMLRNGLVTLDQIN